MLIDDETVVRREWITFIGVLYVAAALILVPLLWCCRGR